MLASSLRRHVHHRAFQQFQQSLLHSFSAHVAGNGRVVALAGNLVDFIDEHDSPFGLFHIVVSHLQQTRKNALNVLSYIPSLRQHGRIHDGERYLQQFGNAAGQQRLAGTGASHHDDVRLFDFHIITPLWLHQPLVMIVDSYREIALGILLTDDILVDEFLDIRRFGKIFQLQLRSILRLFHGFCNYIICLNRTFVTDKAIHSCQHKGHLILRSATKAATSFSLFVQGR